MTPHACAALISLFSLLGIAGCSQSKVPTSNLEQGKQVAKQVLDAWISGSTVDEMQKLSPPIIVSDDLWRKKMKLNSYQFLDEGSMLGPNARFRIQLKYSDNQGRNAERSFAYLVTTTPAMTFFREEP